MRISALRSRRGTSLVEAMATLAVVAISLGGLGLSVIQTQTASRDLRQRDLVRAQSWKLSERIMSVPWGSIMDPHPSTASVAAFLDDDSTTTPATPITLMGLRTPVNAQGWRFRVAGFEAGGVWEIEVNNDLDGNGVFRGIRGTATPTTGDGTTAGDGTTPVTLRSEGRIDLVRVEIFHAGRSVARFLRSVPSEGS